MRNGFFTLLSVIGIIFCLTSCQKEEEALTFESVIAEDFSFINNTAGSSTKAHFYEAQCVLNGKLKQTAADDVKLKSIETVTAANGNVYLTTTDVETGSKFRDIHENASWVGSYSIDPTIVKISFKQAVSIVKTQTEYPAPDSDKMTFRHPLGSIANPLYIFGSTTENYYVSVDAMTGEVSILRSFNMSSFSE